VSPGTRLLARRCEAHPLHTLLLFANLYFGLVLPLHVAYRAEQQQKRAFVERLQLAAEPDWEPPRRSLLLAAAFEVLLAGLLAAQVWVLAVKLDPHVLHYPPAVVYQERS
jgi:hypothetical protein